MKCEDFYATGVVIYVEHKNSEAIRKIHQNFILYSGFARVSSQAPPSY